MKISRRALLKAGTAVTGCVLTPSFVIGAPARFELTRLHEKVIERVKKLAAGRRIQITTLLPDGSEGNVKPVGERFAHATGVDVRYVTTPVDEINANMMLQTVAGNSKFDLALPATFGIPDLVDAETLVNLDEYASLYEPVDFQRDALFSVGDYYKGSLYGYQTDGDTYLIFYNRDWLEDEEENKRFADKYGYPLQIADTWPQLDTMMEHFHRPEENRYGGTLFRTANYIAWEWWIRFHAKGYFPLTEDLEPQINNDAGVEALAELISASRFQYPEARGNGLFANWEAFAEGNKFCNIGWGGTQKHLSGDQSRLKGRLAFGETPGGLVDGELLRTPYFNWGWNYTVSTSSPEPEIAYLFALFACSPEISTIAVRKRDGYFDPFRSAHYEDPEIIEVYSPEFLEVHRASMRYSIPDFYLAGQGQYFDALREYIIKADRGRMRPKDALDTVAKIWRRISRAHGLKAQTEQWLFLRSRYPEGIRAKLR